MKLEHRVQKLEEIMEVKPAPRKITAAINEDGTPCGEFNAKLIREGKEAEARGEVIDWPIFRVITDP